MSRDERGLLVVRLGLDLRNQFKVYCAENDLSMQEVIVEYVLKLLDSDDEE